MTTVSITLTVIGLGGKATPENVPVLMVVHSPMPTIQSDTYPAATSTIPPNAQLLINRPMVTFALDGPTLPPVQITPTPRQIAVGEQVVVVDVGTQQLNVRNTAGVIGTTVRFRADEGTVFTVVEGPQQVDGLLWWKIEDLNDATRTGWAASNYLEIRPGS